MGIFNRLFGDNSRASKEETKQDDEGNIPVTQFFFVGNEIESDPLNESILVLRQAPPDSGDISDAWEWSVVKCNEPVEVDSDMDVKLCSYNEGGVVSAGEAYQSQMAWLLSTEEIEKLSNEDKIIRSFSFPDELRDRTIPVGTRWEEEDLASLLLPFQI
jgi:hypothetical protein